jgi:acyl phosphate:glycerol-3-phosphate acyltransferase
MTTVALILAGYLSGSIPSGYWIVRLFRREDVRQVGSGNIGATNVWRTYGRRLGIPVILVDLGKGFAPAFLGVLLVSDLVGILAGAAAMLGHARPVFLRFARGGKMVATTGGAFFGVAPLVAASCVGVWIVVFLLTRYASVASLAAALAMVVLSIAYGEPWSVVAFASVAAAAVFVLHRANLRRLRAGTESRFHFRRAARA